ncbi:hypothetical protein I3842_03G263600 [Carya illinoinensis]|uniref:Uncharacterized protein n=1 Tax=Carya illinoinensis TaxID=32201 RepID=A0A922FPX5_CARIL|nr:hypothetical protein I3842_03G263600 [Carya illinoinensis]
MAQSEKFVKWHEKIDPGLVQKLEEVARWRNNCHGEYKKEAMKRNRGRKKKTSELGGRRNGTI